MATWWNDLSSLNQTFYVVAVFFSTIFVWQFVSSFGGLGGEEEGGAEVSDTGAGDTTQDLIDDAAGLATFRMLSVRSVMAFGTLFSWAGALYLQQDITPAWALVRALLWGLSGMLVVALFFWVLPRLTEEGTASLDTAVGRNGQVYLNIPEGGLGQIRVLVSGRLRFMRACSRSGQPLRAGTMVRVVKRLDATTLEVEEIET